MTKTQYLETLADNDLTKAVYQRVFHFELNGSHYESATNGHVQAAFRISPDEYKPDLQWPEKRMGYLMPCIVRQPTHTVSSNALWAFLNGEAFNHCPICGGTGKRSEMVKADEFGEFADPFDSPRYVRIGGQQLNGNLLVKHLAAMELPATLRITLAQPNGDETPLPFVFWAEDWFLMIQITCASESEIAADFDKLLPIA